MSWVRIEVRVCTLLVDDTFPLFLPPIDLDLNFFPVSGLISITIWVFGFKVARGLTTFALSFSITSPSAIATTGFCVHKRQIRYSKFIFVQRERSELGSWNYLVSCIICLSIFKTLCLGTSKIRGEEKKKKIDWWDQLENIHVNHLDQSKEIWNRKRVSSNQPCYGARDQGL